LQINHFTHHGNALQTFSFSIFIYGILCRQDAASLVSHHQGNLWRMVTVTTMPAVPANTSDSAAADAAARANSSSTAGSGASAAVHGFQVFLDGILVVQRIIEPLINASNPSAPGRY
jgi:hypothetical protein